MWQEQTQFVSMCVGAYFVRLETNRYQADVGYVQEKIALMCAT